MVQLHTKTLMTIAAKKSAKKLQFVENYILQFQWEFENCVFLSLPSSKEEMDRKIMNICLDQIWIKILYSRRSIHREDENPPPLSPQWDAIVESIQWC